MCEYNFLKDFQYLDLGEAEKNVSVDRPHYFVMLDKKEILDSKNELESKLNISVPQSLIDFWTQIGAGQFFSEPPDEYAGRYIIINPLALLGVYLESDDIDRIYKTIRADANDFLRNYRLLAFCEFSEYSALYISLEADNNGNYCVFKSPTQKIADSLADFCLRLTQEPDYFLDDYIIDGL